MTTLVNIKEWLELHNETNKIWKPSTPAIELATLTREQFKGVQAALESALSPENLTCDGELPQNEVNRRGDFYTKALQELMHFVADADPTYFLGR